MSNQIMKRTLSVITWHNSVGFSLSLLWEAYGFPFCPFVSSNPKMIFKKQMSLVPQSFKLTFNCLVCQWVVFSFSTNNMATPGLWEYHCDHLKKQTDHKLVLNELIKIFLSELPVECCLKQNLEWICGLFLRWNAWWVLRKARKTEQQYLNILGLWFSVDIYTISEKVKLKVNFVWSSASERENKL